MTNLQCNGWCQHSNPVAYIDEKGFIYCGPCGKRRQYSHRCRQLRPWELRLLQRGEQVPSYEPISQAEYLRRRRAEYLKSEDEQAREVAQRIAAIGRRTR